MVGPSPMAVLAIDQVEHVPLARRCKPCQSARCVPRSGGWRLGAAGFPGHRSGPFPGGDALIFGQHPPEQGEIGIHNRRRSGGLVAARNNSRWEGMSASAGSVRAVSPASRRSTRISLAGERGWKPNHPSLQDVRRTANRNKPARRSGRGPGRRDDFCYGSTHQSHSSQDCLIGCGSPWFQRGRIAPSGTGLSRSLPCPARSCPPLIGLQAAKSPRQRVT